MRRTSCWWMMGLILLVGAACTSATPTPTTVPPTALPTAPAVIIVTRPPLEEVVETPTPAVDVSTVLGMWNLNLRFQFEGGPDIDVIRFVGTLNLLVEMDGTVTGEGVLALATSDSNCQVEILEGNQFPVLFQGQLQPAGDDGTEVDLTFSLSPQDAQQREHYRVSCATEPEAFMVDQQTLWPALQQLDMQPFTLPLTPGAAITRSDETGMLSLPNTPATLTTEIRLNR